MGDGPTMIRELDRYIFPWTKDGDRRRVLGYVTPQEFDSLAGTLGHDSEPAIQACFQTVKSGGTIYLPPGNYEIASGAQALLIKDDVTVLGAGRDSTIIDGSSNTTGTAPVRTEASGVTFQGITFLGAGAAASGAVLSNGGGGKVRLTVVSCRFIDCNGQALTVSHDDTVIAYNEFLDSERSDIFIGANPKNVVIFGNISSGVNQERVAGSGFVRVSGGGAGTLTEGISIVGNTIRDYYGNGIIIFNGGSTTDVRTKGITIVGNTFDNMLGDNQGGTEGEAISATCSGLVVVGNYFRRTWNEAVNWSIFNAQVQGFICANNYIEDATQELGTITQNNGAAIEIVALQSTSDASGFAIFGNVCVDTRATKKTRAVVSLNMGGGGIVRDGKVYGNTGVGMTVGEVELTGTLLGVRINGVGIEATNAEQPTAADWSPGEIVEFTDTGDASGDGLYVLARDGATWFKVT